MNALLEFIILTSLSFFLFMFLGYRDAIRSKPPKGIIANLFDKLSFWKKEDDKGIRGYLFRQNIIVKLLVAVVAAILIRVAYALVFDFSIASERFNMFTGISALLMHSAAILLGIYLSYLWPSVTQKMGDIKGQVIKNDTPKEENKSIEPPVKTEIKEAPKPQPTDRKKDDPNDIINDYLN